LFRYLFNVIGTKINVYSVISGEVIYKLSYNPNSNNTDDEKNAKADLLIISICLNPINKYQLLSFNQNGVICLWDYQEGLFLKSFETNILIKKIISIEKSLYAIGQLKKVDFEQPLSVYKLNLTGMILKEKDKNNLIKHEIVLSNLIVNMKKIELAINKNEKYIAYIESPKRLIINQFKPLNMFKK
jgi:hypothetical protein